MKKLLTILGSIGMITGTATSVVACGVFIPTSDQRISLLDIDDINVVEGETKEEIQARIQARIQKAINSNLAKTIRPVFGMDYEIIWPSDELLAGEIITVKANATSEWLRDYFEIRIQAKTLIHDQRISLLGIRVTDIIEGDEREEILEKIQKAIDNKLKEIKGNDQKAVFGKDYVVDGLEEKWTEPGIILVRAKDESELIKDSFVIRMKDKAPIQIIKISISDINDIEAVVDYEREEIAEKIQKAIDNKLAEANPDRVKEAVLGIDYTIEWPNDESVVGNNIIVKASDKSMLIIDWFEIKIKPSHEIIDGNFDKKTAVPNGVNYFFFDESLIKDYDEVEVVEVDHNGQEIKDESFKKLRYAWLYEKGWINNSGLTEDMIPTEGPDQRTVSITAKNHVGLAYVKLKGVKKSNSKTKTKEFLNVNFVVDIKKFNIASLNNKLNAYVGEEQKTIESRVQTMIDTATFMHTSEDMKNITEPKRDFVIKHYPLHDGIHVGDQITVIANKSSKSIFGEFSFKLKADTRVDIWDLQWQFTPKPAETFKTFKNRFQEALNDKYPELNLQLKKDFFILSNPLLNDDDIIAGQRITINAHINSDKIKCEIKYFVPPGK
ncbi:hypothetical protein ELUMI_v1c00850 [Williamsoniiplasma luminosum]|uniref:Lipoprotein n=1 Tax=Williamsoniiplasma luminosum TaxID=214888 RepID=A0A2K8NVZ8_9MOLU|nr:lipoprotein [Williamsoniiplasma luminosum]ATZ16813.1 hypothetical protein ELUMI_v1c00850 [Williamsoniiplasma luminosum]